MGRVFQVFAGSVFRCQPIRAPKSRKDARKTDPFARMGGFPGRLFGRRSRLRPAAAPARARKTLKTTHASMGRFFAVPGAGAHAKNAGNPPILVWVVFRCPWRCRQRRKNCRCLGRLFWVLGSRFGAGRSGRAPKSENACKNRPICSCGLCFRVFFSGAKAGFGRPAPENARENAENHPY